MRTEEQMQAAAMRNFVGHARALAARSDARSAGRSSKNMGRYFKDSSVIAIVLAFVVPGIVLSGFSAYVYSYDGATTVNDVLHRHHIWLSHLSNDYLEGLRNYIIDTKYWLALAEVAAVLVLFCPMMNVLTRARP